jgi:hypothetical protein
LNPSLSAINDKGAIRPLYRLLMVGSNPRPLTEVRDLLGHTTVKMTERYAHLAPENVRAAVTLLEGGWSRSGHAEEKEVTGIRGICR